MTELLVICGMHRSGTSLVAQLLRELGWDVGPASDLMPAKPDNPRGFVEHLPAVRLNDRLLYRLGGTWSAPPALPPGWAERRDLDDLREEAARITASLRARGSARVLLKDPRFSLTLPFWRTVTDIERTLLVLRAPDEVVASLQHRDDELEEATAAALWNTYTLCALRDSGQRPMCVTSTADLLEDLPLRLRALARDLGHDPTDDEFAAAHEVVEEQLWGRSVRERPKRVTTSPAALDRARMLHRVLTGEDATQWRSTLAGLTTVEELRASARVTSAFLEAERARHAKVSERVPRLLEHLEGVREDVERLRDERDRARARAEQAHQLLAARSSTRAPATPDDSSGDLPPPPTDRGRDNDR